MAESDYYNPYTMFEWPDTLELDKPWMSEDLVTLAGTEFWDELPREQQLALTRHEAVNFFSLNVHGIRELLSEVVLRIHTKTYADASEFLHHFIGEENEHMWFFSAFCLRYGKKIYPAAPNLTPATDDGLSKAASELVIFARILMFEEIVDYFNAHMATDTSLPKIAQDINRIHHQDESRHVAFGRTIFTQLLQQVKEKNPEDIPRLVTYLDAYLDYSIRSLYNPAVYRDAGLNSPLELRRQLLEHPARAEAHDRILKRTRKFLARNGLIAQEAVA
ncbi:AurF domain containing protein [Streptomyces triticagri]|uniref:AurF domain containing protein n=2 Tax=Streptomyces triticagri TaxID=2293568 RepID=A0A372M925_9ACTN|nr:AurF domain containing protein [Streptomyces triticagri]